VIACSAFAALLNKVNTTLRMIRTYSSNAGAAFIEAGQIYVRVHYRVARNMCSTEVIDVLESEIECALE
jgi:hypothetical protein